MGIDERRERERKRRRGDIIEAAWLVAEECGWSAFSMERVASRAELGRATLYSYFDSLELLIVDLARIALVELEEALAAARAVSAALDVPVRLSQRHPARFELLFPNHTDPRAHMTSPPLRDIQSRARELMLRLERVARNQAVALPKDSRESAAFLAAVSMAGATVPELKNSTTLRHRFHDFCLGSSDEHDS